MRLAVKAISAAVLMLLSEISLAQQESCGANCFPKRWVYFGGNLSLANDVVVLKRLIPDAKANGYNGIAFSSGGSGSYGKLVPELLQEPYTSIVKKNLEEVVKVAQANNIELIPVGGGPEVPAAFYPDQVEALPASATYQVANGIASIVRTPIDINGRFTTSTGWSMDKTYVSLDNGEGRIAAPGETPSSVKISATSRSENARLIRQVKLSRNKAYRWSFWIKVGPGYDTRRLFARVIPVGKTGPIYRNVNSRLGWGTLPDGTWNPKGNSDPGMITSSQDWKRYDLDFNTGDNESVNIYLGTQSAGVANTNIWVDDTEIVELGLAHPVVRSTTPITVTSLKTGAVYTAGTDYSLTGQDKTSLSIFKTGKIPHGDELKVSWYQSGVNMLARSGTPATSCGSNAIPYVGAQKKLYDAIKPYFSGKFAGQASDRYFMYYDEIRLMNWDPSCGNKTAGETLRQMVNGSVAAISQSNSSGARPVEILTWNDMFDKEMNAVPSYYHVNGDLGTWTTPLNPSIVIVNWTANKAWTATNLADRRKRSLKQFAADKHKQVIALYYDYEDMSNVDGWLSVMSAVPTVPLDGVMYTTWRHVSPKDYPYEQVYGNLRSVANKMRKAYPDRWPN